METMQVMDAMQALLAMQAHFQDTTIIALLPLFPTAERLLIIAAVRSPGRGPLRQRRV